ncbi:dTMP kinase [Marinomonas ostreistagni]|uniref:dTMP kinase n=1 Tax=Marinomonas ostreistagni TaxID=359209 RepID=UPI00194ECD5D|nr:dTMP kinase [Marinomonas ostreistagni]MBM6550287.1 dTMP kinase [Marinomonas ostreistagni]
MAGKFISIEGGEGAGKSSALATIEAWLKSQKIDYVLTREPGGTPMAEEIRALMLSARDEAVASETELLLVFAARVQHIKQHIEPALAAGKWVISDRFLDSTYVYQGAARGLDESLIDVLAERFIGQSLPDTTLLLDVPVEVGLSRVASRGESNRLDRESVVFHEKVRQGFLLRAQQSPERIKIIDAALELEAVQQQILHALDTLKAS